MPPLLGMPILFRGRLISSLRLSPKRGHLLQWHAHLNFHLKECDFSFTHMYEGLLAGSENIQEFFRKK